MKTINKDTGSYGTIKKSEVVNSEASKKYLDSLAQVKENINLVLNGLTMYKIIIKSNVEVIEKIEKGGSAPLVELW